MPAGCHGSDALPLFFATTSLRAVDGSDNYPAPADLAKPTTDEAKAIAKLKKGDGKVRSKIELSLGNSQMIHLAGAQTAAQM
jgi:hypothetical protein